MPRLFIGKPEAVMVEPDLVAADIEKSEVPRAKRALEQAPMGTTSNVKRGLVSEERKKKR